MSNLRSVVWKILKVSVTGVTLLPDQPYNLFLDVFVFFSAYKCGPTHPVHRWRSEIQYTFQSAEKLTVQAKWTNVGHKRHLQDTILLSIFLPTWLSYALFLCLFITLQIMFVRWLILRCELHQDNFEALLTIPYSNTKPIMFVKCKHFRFYQETILTRYLLSVHKMNADPSGRAV